MTDNGSTQTAAEGPTEAQKEAVLGAVGIGCTRGMAAAAGDMTREELRDALDDDEEFARRLEIARGQAGVAVVRALWGSGNQSGQATAAGEAKESQEGTKGPKDPKICMWLLENLILPRRSAARSKAQGRRGQGDGEEGENRVSLGTQRLIEALERLGVQPAPSVGGPADGPGGGVG